MALISLVPVSNELAVAGRSMKASNGVNYQSCLSATAFRYTTMKIESLVSAYNDGLIAGHAAGRSGSTRLLATHRQAYNRALSKYRHKDIARYYAAGWINGLRLTGALNKPTPKPTIGLVGIYTLKAA